MASLATIPYGQPTQYKKGDTHTGGLLSDTRPSFRRSNSRMMAPEARSTCATTRARSRETVWLLGIGVFFNTRKGQFQYKISLYIISILYHSM